MAKHKWTLYKRDDCGDVLWVRFFIGGQRVRRSTEISDALPAERIPREHEAHRVAARVYAEALAGAGQPLTPETRALARRSFDALTDAWTADLEQRAAEFREQHVYRAKADVKVLTRFSGWNWADEITEASWETLKRKLHHSNKGPLGWRSIQHLTTTLRKLAAFAVSVGALEKMPTLKPPKAKLVRDEQAERSALSEEQRDAWIKVLAKPFAVSARFYVLMFYTLLRRGEVFALSRRWIDFGANTIRVPPRDSKNGEPRVIPMHPLVVKALRAQMTARKVVDPGAPLFGQHDIRPAFRYALAHVKVKGKKIDPHGLTPYHIGRHTGATILGAKTDFVTLKAIGGWERDEMVTRYAHAQVDRMRQAVAKL